MNMKIRFVATMFVAIGFIAGISSCAKDDEYFGNNDNYSKSENVEDGEDAIVLGEKMNDPYNMAFMSEAFQQLKAEGAELPFDVLEPTGLYVRVLAGSTAELDLLEACCFICDSNLLNFAVEILRNEESNLSFDTLGFTLDNGVTHTVTAFIAVKLSLYGRPAGVPYVAAVVDVEITSAHINGNVVVAITGNAAESCVLIEAVTARCIGAKGEESLCSEVVYPRIRCTG